MNRGVPPSLMNVCVVVIVCALLIKTVLVLFVVVSWHALTMAHLY